MTACFPLEMRLNADDVGHDATHQLDEGAMHPVAIDGRARSDLKIASMVGATDGGGGQRPQARLRISISVGAKASRLTSKIASGS